MVIDINNKLKSIYDKQKKAYLLANKLSYYSNEDIIDIPYYKVKSNIPKIDIKLEYLYLTDKYLSEFHENRFVTKKVIENVFIHEYQKINSNSSYIKQTIPDDNSLYLVSNEYIESNLLLKDRPILRNCYLIEQVFSELKNNELLGLNTISHNYLKTNEELDLETYNKIGNELFFIENNSFYGKTLEVSNIEVEYIEVLKPVFYFNKKTFCDKFIFDDNQNVDDWAVLPQSNNHNMVTLFYVSNYLSTNKTPVNFITTDLTKEDSLETGLVDDVFEYITKNTSFSNEEEVVSYEEAEKVIDKIVSYIIEQTKGCNK